MKRVFLAICCVLMLFGIVIFPISAETTEDTYPVIDQDGVEYDLTQYPYLSFDIATAYGLPYIDTYLTLDTRLLLSGQTDFVLAIDGGIEFVFDSAGLNYIVNAKSASYRLSVSTSGSAVDVLLDLIFTDVQLYQNGSTDWVKIGDYDKLYSSFGLLRYNIDDSGHMIDSTLKHYYSSLSVGWLDDYTIQVPYALTMFSTGTLTFHGLSSARLNMYLPLGTSTGSGNITWQSQYYYGLGGLFTLSNSKYLRSDVLAILPVFGQSLVELASNTDFTSSWWRGHEQGRQTGYAQGYNAGRESGLQTADVGTFGNLLSGIFDGMYNLFSSILDFDIPIGNSTINFAGIAGMLIALMLVVIVVRFLLR